MVRGVVRSIITRTTIVCYNFHFDNQLANCNIYVQGFAESL